MTETEKAQTQRWPPRQNVALFLVLTTAGLAGNYWRYPLFFGIDFLFGSIFTMLALQLLGPGWGIAAAALAGTVTYLDWGHPWAIVFLTGEAAAVALLTRHTRLSFVLADSLYWLCGGMPLILFFFHLVMGLPLETAFILMPKMAINHIANTLAARFVFMAVTRRLQEPRFSFREVVFNLLILFVLTPSLVILTTEIRRDFIDTDAAIRGSLGLTRDRLAITIERWIHEQYVHTGAVDVVPGLKDLEAILAVVGRAQVLRQVAYILLDKNNRVLTTNRDDLKIMDSFVANPGERIRFDDGIELYLPPGRSNIAIVDRWRRGLYIAESPIGPLTEWRLILEQPLALYQEELHRKYSGQFGRIFFILLAGLVLAEFVCRKAIGSLEALLLSSSNLPAKIIAGEPMPWPRTSLFETGQLIANFKALATALTLKFHELAEMNATLETRVAARTDDLTAEIEERRQAEERYRQLARERKLLLDTLTVAVLYVQERRILWVNAAMRRIFGYTPTVELTGLDARELYCDIFDFQRVGLGYAQIAHGLVFTSEAAFRRRDGSVFWGSITGRAVDPARPEEKSLWMIADVTDHRRVEATLRENEFRYRALMEHIPDYVVRYDQGKRHIYANTRVIRDLDRRPETIIGLTHRELGFPDNICLIYEQSIDAVFASGQPDQRVYLWDTPGGQRWVEWRMVPELIPGGHIEAVLGLGRDITARVEAEEALRRQSRNLEELTLYLEKRVEEEVERRRRNEQILVQQAKLAAMGEMIGAIAHQWRQPLNTLGLCIQNVRDAHNFGELTGKLLDNTVRKAMNQIQHMSKTIDDFRNFFHPGKEMESFDAMVAVGEVLALFSAQLAANDIAFSLTCHSHGLTFTQIADIIPCAEKTVVGFRNEFEHVVLNILANAKDAIITARARDPEKGRGQGLIRFDFDNRDDRPDGGSVASAREGAGATGWVFITISDNGTGIPAELIDRIFEPYFTTKDSIMGTGIGLYMAKIIIEEHMHGKLTGENHGDGARFTIALPAPPTALPRAQA